MMYYQLRQAISCGQLEIMGSILLVKTKGEIMFLKEGYKNDM